MPRFARQWFAALALGAALFAPAGASAFERVAYTNDVLEWARENPTYIIFVHADWCSTCQAQDRVLERLADDPRFANLRIVVVDYDTQTHIMRVFDVQVRSTLIAYRGGAEVERMTGVVGLGDIEAFLLRYVQ